MIKIIKKSIFYLGVLRIRAIFHKGGLGPGFFVIPGIFAFFSSIFEGVSIVLLIPTVKGLFERNFDFVVNLPILGWLLKIVMDPLAIKQNMIFLFLMILIFIMSICSNIFRYFSSVAMFFLIRKLTDNLRKKIYGRYLSFGKMFFDKSDMGYLYRVLSGFTESIATKLRQVEDVIAYAISLTLYSSLMIVISWQLALLTLLVSPLLYFSLSWLIKKIKKTSLALSDAHSKLSSSIANSLYLIPLIKAYASETREKEWFAYASGRERSVQFSMDKKQALIDPLYHILSLSLTLLLVAAMAFMLMDMKIGNVAGYMVFFLALRRASIYFAGLNNFRSTLASMKGPLREIDKVFDDKDKFFIKSGEREFPGLRKEIVFDNVSFLYPEGVSALNGVTATIEKGKTTAIVGASGCGKTTLINLIMRFYEIQGGRILMDGVDIRDFALPSLMSGIALVSQEVFLLNASLKVNLTYGLKKEVSKECLEEAIQLSGLSELISFLPGGLDTVVGDRGVKLSGGEKQRISIARAILKNAEIIILDEATSALDSITESIIQKALLGLMENKTAIVVAHRLSTIKHADKIIVLDAGKVVEEGSLESLLAKKGKFYDFWQMQKFF